MTNREGTPIWYELMTDDPDAAQKFYESVMGWKFEAMPGGSDIDYRIASAKDKTAARIEKPSGERTFGSDCAKVC